MRQRSFRPLKGLAAEDNTYARQLTIPYFSSLLLFIIQARDVGVTGQNELYPFPP